LRWFGHLEYNDDVDWIKHCTIMEVDGVKQKRCSRKTWADVKNFELFGKDT